MLAGQLMAEQESYLGNLATEPSSEAPCYITLNAYSQLKATLQVQENLCLDMFLSSRKKALKIVWKV